MEFKKAVGVDEWFILCINPYRACNYVQFVPGTLYAVKDKFTGPDGDLNTGFWEVKDGHGGLVNISREERDKYFICHYNQI